MSRILLVDDDAHLVHTLRWALEQEGHDVMAAIDARSGIATATEESPDLIVLDLRLPDLDGVEVVGRLRAHYQGPILILSGVTDVRLKVGALDAGADDYLNKPFGMPELTARLRALLRRGTATDDRLLEFPDLEVDLAARTVRVADREQRLTPTEWRILEAMATHPDRLLSHAWLVREVWGDTHGEESKQALRSHVRSLRAKLGDDAAAPRFVRTESGAGYRWLPSRTGVRSAVDAAAAPLGELPAPVAVPPDFEAFMGLRAFDEVMHDLYNVLTAMRVAAYLESRRPGRDADASQRESDDMALRWPGLVQRASLLAVELEHTRAPRRRHEEERR